MHIYIHIYRYISFSSNQKLIPNGWWWWWWWWRWCWLMVRNCIKLKRKSIKASAKEAQQKQKTKKLQRKEESSNSLFMQKFICLFIQSNECMTVLHGVWNGNEYEYEMVYMVLREREGERDRQWLVVCLSDSFQGINFRDVFWMMLFTHSVMCWIANGIACQFFT